MNRADLSLGTDLSMTGLTSSSPSHRRPGEMMSVISGSFFNTQTLFETDVWACLSERRAIVSLETNVEWRGMTAHG
jgi:hypothetical protein